MRNSALIDQLSVLQPTEIKAFERFIHSPYFNTNPRIIALFSALKNYHPNFDDPSLSKALIRKAISPDKLIQAGTFRNLQNQLTKLVRNFLIQQRLEQRDSLKERLLLEAYSNRKLKKAFDAAYAQIQIPKENIPADRYYHLEQYLTLEKYYHFPHTDRYTIDSKYLSRTVEHLDHFYILSQLILQIEANSRAILLKEKMPNFFFKEKILAFIKIIPKKERALFDLLVLILKIQHTPTKSLVEKAVKLFEINYQNFSGLDSQMILLILIYQMNKLYQSGIIAYFKKMFLLYRFGIESRILLFDHSLSVDDYLNIVTCASRNKETKWATEFINSNTKYLLKIEQDQASTLAKTIVHFDQGNYNLVSQTLIKNPFRNINIGFRYKLLILKGHIEHSCRNKNEIKWVLERIKVIQRSIKRIKKKSNNVNIPLFLNFITVAKILLRKIKKSEAINAKIFQVIIEEHSPIIAKKWLLQKIQSLEQP